MPTRSMDVSSISSIALTRIEPVETLQLVHVVSLVHRITSNGHRLVAVFGGHWTWEFDRHGSFHVHVNMQEAGDRQIRK